MKARYVITREVKSFIIVLLSVFLMTLLSCQKSIQEDTPSQSSAVIDRINDKMPVFPYGAVYFRKSNPPADDWESDYKTALDLGVNTFRHWFMWEVIEIAPGVYDWSDYDRQMDLAAQNGIKIIIAESSNRAPEWMGDKYPEGRRVSSDGSPSYPSMHVSAVTGGISMCLDNEDVLRKEEKFLKALIERYRDHPATLGYDLWNEMSHGQCYCEATQEKFHEWLKEKYGSLEALGKVWNRYSIGSWEYLLPPRGSGGYADAIDWIEFTRDNKSRLLKRRIDLFRSLDNKHLITGHTAFVASSIYPYPVTQCDWRDATDFDVFGYTWVSSRNSNTPWMQFQAVDFTRSSSRGKPFWHAEAEAGSMWLQPQVIGRAREDGRISDEEDVRIHNIISMAGGATGILYPRWRPLLDGPLWSAFGPMGMDGSVTPKAEMAGKIAKWANANTELWKSRPIKGDIGIVWVPESQIFNYVQLGRTEYHSTSVRGVYQGFFDSNIQADFVHIDDINEYPVAYLPYPVMLKKETADKLINYVKNGGRLICEGLPGYFDDRGHVGVIQPNLGLDQLFGAREKYVEFVPDLLDNLTLQVRGSKINGRYFLQEYVPEGGEIVGTYENGSAAAIENEFGNGKTLLIGTYPSAGYARHHTQGTKDFFAGLLEWGNVVQRITSNDTEIIARLHVGAGGKYLWVINPTRTSREVNIRFNNPEDGGLSIGNDIWEGKQTTLSGNTVKVKVDARDVAVIQLQ